MNTRKFEAPYGQCYEMNTHRRPLQRVLHVTVWVNVPARRSEGSSCVSISLGRWLHGPSPWKQRPGVVCGRQASVGSGAVWLVYTTSWVMRMRLQSHMHTHTRARTHTHTHTHTPRKAKCCTRNKPGECTATIQLVPLRTQCAYYAIRITGMYRGVVKSSFIGKDRWVKITCSIRIGRGVYVACITACDPGVYIACITACDTGVYIASIAIMDRGDYISGIIGIYRCAYISYIYGMDRGVIIASRRGL
jgi:hypothetical protein